MNAIKMTQAELKAKMDRKKRLNDNAEEMLEELKRTERRLAACANWLQNFGFKDQAAIANSWSFDCNQVISKIERAE